MIDVIMSRRSIRRFEERPVPDALLHQLLSAVMQAPSAKNERPWEFLIVRDPALLQLLAQTDPYSGCIKNAPMAIVLLCNKNKYLKETDTFWREDMSAAAMSLLLAAHGLSLGTTWLAVAPLQERIDHVAAALSLPEGVVPFALFPLGYPLRPKEPEPRYEPERIHYDTYPGD